MTVTQIARLDAWMAGARTRPARQPAPVGQGAEGDPR